MSAPASTVSSYARSSGQPRRLVLDPWVIGTVSALLLIGLIMVASASIGISEKETGAAFHYFTRQLVYVALGLAAGCIGLAVPTRIWDEYSQYLLGAAFLLLVLVLVPGIGAEVNGSRRWVFPGNRLPSSRTGQTTRQFSRSSPTTIRFGRPGSFMTSSSSGIRAILDGHTTTRPF